MAHRYFPTHGGELSLHPPLTPRRENRLQVAFKQGASVLEVLFGVGSGGGDAVEGFVEDGDDALLLGKRRECNSLPSNIAVGNCGITCPLLKHFNLPAEFLAEKSIEQEAMIDFRLWP